MQNTFKHNENFISLELRSECFLFHKKLRDVCYYYVCVIVSC